VTEQHPRQTAATLLKLKQQIRQEERAVRARQNARARLAYKAERDMQQVRQTMRRIDELQSEEHELGRELADLEERATAAVRGLPALRGTYWATIGRPPICKPDDREAAAVYHRSIVEALEQSRWTHSERTALHNLEKLWRRRMLGQEARFLCVGTRRGRLPRVVEDRIVLLRKDRGLV
jgi:ATP-dependent Clp protease ATP-binding subunit ClpA